MAVKKKRPVRKTIYSGSCKGCRILTDCAKCTMCRDKPKFGGPGVKKQKCERRRCEHHLRPGNRLVNRPDQILDLPIRTSEPLDLRTSGGEEDTSSSKSEEEEWHKDPGTCRTCGRVCGSSMKLKAHRNAVHGGVTFICRKCA